MKTHLTHEELLQHLAQFILDATDAHHSGDLSEDELPTAGDMARRLGLDSELVKKKLKVLKHEGLIQALSYSPKRYRFDRYQLTHLNEDNLLYPLFCGDEPNFPLY